MPNETFFYRFRSIGALLGDRQELEKQEIYFPTPEQLNDPMEGYKELFWRGDEIVWRNLLRHYLLCLLQTTITAIVQGKDYQPVITRGFVFGTQLSLPTDTYKAIYQRLCTAFFASHNISTLPALFAKRPHPFRRDELEFCLRALHPLAFNTIVRVFREEKLMPPADASPPAQEFSEETIANNLLKVLNTIKGDDSEIDPEAVHHLFNAAGLIHRQIDLIKYLGTTNELARAWHSIFYSFPERYVDSLGDLVYFDWYAACFVADPAHAAMWGNYGDGHKGVCLKFRAEERTGSSPILKLHGIVGWHGGGPQGVQPCYGDLALSFEEMTYAEKMTEIDFFRSIGRLPIPALRAGWYSDDKGQISPCAEHVFAQKNEWHQEYWTAFRAMTTTKLRYWQHENEYRLMLTSVLDSFQKDEDRKLTYRFADLEGIVFGIRTPLEAKVQILNIIGAKCKEHGRKSFEFSQAVYAAHSGKIEIRPLSLLRFTGS